MDGLSGGQGRLKAFKADSYGGQAVGAIDLPWALDFNDLETHARIDSSDFVHPVFGNMLAIVYGTETGGFHLSIFFEDELSW